MDGYISVRLNCQHLSSVPVRQHGNLSAVLHSSPSISIICILLVTDLCNVRLFACGAHLDCPQRHKDARQHTANQKHTYRFGFQFECFFHKNSPPESKIYKMSPVSENHIIGRVTKALQIRANNFFIFTLNIHQYKCRTDTP